MRILEVEVLNDEDAVNLSRLARRERREERRRLLEMSGKDVAELFWIDLSDFHFRLTQPIEEITDESALPSPIAADVGKYEDSDAIALLQFVCRNIPRPIMVRFASDPSKNWVERLRQAAKSRNVRIHFFRLLKSYALLRIE